MNPYPTPDDCLLPDYAESKAKPVIAASAYFHFVEYPDSPRQAQEAGKSGSGMACLPACHSTLIRASLMTFPQRATSDFT